MGLSDWDVANANSPFASTVPVLAYDELIYETGLGSDLQRALAQIRDRWLWYERYNAYYAGLHRFNYATDKFRSTFGHLYHSLADNLCQVVVDTPADRMQITGFTVEQGADGAGDLADALWQQNRMDERAALVHKEAMRCGDGYVLVWPDETGLPIFWPQHAMNTTVLYDDEHPERLLWAAKVWIRQTDGFARFNLYYADRIEKFISIGKSDNMLPADSLKFVPYIEPGEGWPLMNPWGVVPMFHFANNAWIASFGRSELASVIPLQDALNKALCDMMVGMEFNSFPQRWATGLEVELDDAGRVKKPFEPGADRVWAVANEDVKFGQFEPAALKNYIEVQESLRGEIARVSGLPPYYFMPQTGSWPSGESLKTAESRLVAKVKAREACFGNVWEDCMQLALIMQNKGTLDLRLSTQWDDPESASEMEELNQLLLKQKIGVPDQWLLGEAGYGEQDIETMMEEKKAATPPQLMVPEAQVPGQQPAPPVPAPARTPPPVAPVGGGGGRKP